MPAFATHYIFAKELLPRLPADFNSEAVLLGTQGPDFLFYNRLLPNMRGKPGISIGSGLHAADPAVMFGNMRDSLTDNIIAKSFAAGFLMHYALDRNAHPYVYYIEEQYIKARHVHYWDFSVHNRIELNIDSYMLIEHMGYKDARDFLPSEVICLDDEILTPIGELLASTINKTLGNELTPEDVAIGYEDMSHIHSLLRNKGGKRSAILNLLQLPTYLFLGPVITTSTRPERPDNRWDYMNLNRNAWCYLKDSSRCSRETFDEIFERAKEDALGLIDGFFSGADLELLTQSLSFSTGVRV